MDEPETPLSEADARNLRFLRVLVMLLTGTMIAGMAVLVVLFATRFPGSRENTQEGMPLPPGVVLPDDATVLSVTRGADWWAVTVPGAVLIYGVSGGVPVQRLELPDHDIR